MGRILKKAADLLIYSNILISAGAGLFIWETYVLMRQPVLVVYIMLGFAATLFTYNIDRLLGIKDDIVSGNERHMWIYRNAKLLRALCILTGLYMGISVFFLPFRIILFLVHLGAISIFYSLPFIPRHGRWHSLRSIKGLKIFLITYVWFAATVGMPALAEHRSLLDKDVIMLALERGFFIFGITLPFDIRDYKTDKANGVTTIPALVGLAAARRLAFLCLMLCGAVCMLHYPVGSPFLWAKGISVISTLLIVYFAGEDRHEYYFTGLLDGTIIIQFLLVMGFCVIFA